ncbi:MAG: hypothetical protein U5L11_17195 [Arhodomonas sp.]|nr:hypothetical protein [Arhodomonas sp.]
MLRTDRAVQAIVNVFKTAQAPEERYDVEVVSVRELVRRALTGGPSRIKCRHPVYVPSEQAQEVLRALRS